MARRNNSYDIFIYPNFLLRRGISVSAEGMEDSTIRRMRGPPHEVASVMRFGHLKEVGGMI